MKNTKQKGRPIPSKTYDQKEVDELAEHLLEKCASCDLPDCLAGAPLASEEQA
tara:strand:- start:1125 stop:1283 length:159 start_codon:yes stop_codon:yes gene_type:complete